MNVLYILSDQHNPEYSGCYGHPITRTPHIDALAARGTRFATAYSVSPICASTRAAMLTGRYAHEIGAWDNVFAYTGAPRGLGHYLRAAGVRLATIGKLDYTPGAAHGIEECHLAQHRENLDITSLYREQPILARYDLLTKHRATGPAPDLAAYAADAAVAETAAEWLADAPHGDSRPWVLVVNFNDLHRPWNPPQQLWDDYAARLADVPPDPRFSEDLDRLHPFHRTFARHHLGDLLSTEEARRAAIGYQASCEILDGHVGQVLTALDDAGLKDTTLVVYAADHGGTVGEHRNFDHGAMYDGSIRIPLIFAGPSVAEGAVVEGVVSALDIGPTVCEMSAGQIPVELRGQSLRGVLEAGGRSPHTGPDFALTEYHGAGYNASLFSVRSDRYKLVECVGERPMLFDLIDDPLELDDLAAAGLPRGAAGVAAERLRRRLHDICSPEAVDVRCKADQRARRRALARSGQLIPALVRRGYAPDVERLVHRADFLASLDLPAPA